MILRPGMAATLDLKLTSLREPCSEAPYSATEAILALPRSTTAKLISGSIPRLGFASGRTSKMSHDLRRRGSCSITIWIMLLHFEDRKIARDVTAKVVGSGALLAVFIFFRISAAM